MDQEDHWSAWMRNSEELKASHPEGVRYFAAIQIDARGLDPFKPFIDRLEAIGGEYWVYSFDDGRTKVDGWNRLRHLTVGQNMCSVWSQDAGASHMLFLAADLAPEPDTLPKLLACNYPFVGGHVSTYCFKGRRDELEGGIPIEWHHPTAAYVLIARELYTRIRWRYDGNLSDDPAYDFDANELFGKPGMIRMDCIGRHYPEAVPPTYEQRGHADLTVYR